MSKGMTVKVRTPTKTWSVHDVFEANRIFKEEIKKNVSRVCLKQMNQDIIEAAISNMLIFATFFQRVVSRTPLDEDYTWYEEIDGKRIKYHHKADKIQCRYDWYIENDVTKIYAKDMLSQGVDFKYVNNQSDIDRIASILEVNFDFYDEKNLERIYIGNDNPHYQVLEFGGGRGWKDGGVIKNGQLYEHGVENRHSVQAPVGMRRITEAELAGKTLTKSQISKYIAGNKRGMRRIPNDKELLAFYEILKHSKIKYADIKRYIGMR